MMFYDSYSFVVMVLTCDVCGKSISRYDEYLTCRKQCNKNFHIVCVEISGSEFTSLKESGDIKHWSCNNCNTNKTINPTIKAGKTCDNEDSLNNLIMEKVNDALKLFGKTVVDTLMQQISELKLQNLVLTREIQQLKKVTLKFDSFSSIPEKDKRDTSPVTKNDIVDNVNIQTNIDYSDKIKATYSSIAKATGAIKKTIVNNTKQNILSQKTAIKENDLSKHTVLSEITETHNKINSSNKITLNQHTNEFTEVIKRRSNNSQRNIIKGTATSSILKSAKFYSHIHLYGLDIGTTCEEITKNLENHNIPETLCEKMNAKHPDLYSSFKVSIPTIQLKDALNPEIWPSGVKMNRFLARRQQKPQVT